MSQNSIRLVRTEDVDKVISYLMNRYPLLSEAEIIKLALSEKFQKEKKLVEDEEIPSDYLLNSFKNADEQLKKGEASPTFDNGEDLIDYLHKQ
jgi:hypothetical protein